MKPLITVVMVTFNEQRMLAAALDSIVDLADEILVGDLGSSDASLEIARGCGATVEQLPHVPAVEQARPALVDRARGDWILLLDPDEVVDRKLAASLQNLASLGNFEAAELTFHTYMMGRRLQGSGWSPRRERHIRFFRKGSVSLPTEVHSLPQPTEGARVASLDESFGVVHHFNYVSWEQFIEKMNRYTSVEAKERFDAGARPSLTTLLKELVLEIASRGIHDRAWRDGWRGVGLVVLMLGYRSSVFVKHRLLTELGSEQDVIEADRRAANRLMRRAEGA